MSWHLKSLATRLLVQHQFLLISKKTSKPCFAGSFWRESTGNQWIPFTKDQWWGELPDCKVHGANIGPTWVLSDPDRPHVGPINLVMRAFPCQNIIMSKRLFPDVYITSCSIQHRLDIIFHIVLFIYQQNRNAYCTHKIKKASSKFN